MVGLKDKVMYALLALSLMGLTGCLGSESNSFSQTANSSSVGDILLIGETDDDIDAGDEDESEEAIAEENEDLDNESVVDEDLDLDSEVDESEDGEGEDTELVHEDDEGDVNCQRRGNLISNGSFELVDDRKGYLYSSSLGGIEQSGWDVYGSLPSSEEGVDSWVTTDGAGIEVQGYNVVTSSRHGSRKVELDSHGEGTNSSMAQMVYLCKGKYTLRFAYYPRTSTQDDNIITVKLNDKQIKSVNKVYTGKWHTIRRSFRVQKSGEYKLTFSAEGKENSLGGLIDHVRLHKKVKRAGVVTSLLALGDMDNIDSPLISEEVSKSIVNKLVNYASLEKKPSILIVKDANHNGESVEDYELIKKILVDKHGADKVKELSGSLSLDKAKEADVIFVINPGHPLGSKETADVIREVIKTGEIGVVLSGDDMARGSGFSLNDITGVKYTDNGVRACGVYVDNNKGASYQVKLKKRSFRRLSANERVLSYGNDIDHVEIDNKKVKVLAHATTEACGKDIKYPTILGYKLEKPE